jgi:hypothetical protein
VEEWEGVKENHIPRNVLWNKPILQGMLKGFTDILSYSEVLTEF